VAEAVLLVMNTDDFHRQQTIHLRTNCINRLHALFIF